MGGPSADSGRVTSWAPSPWAYGCEYRRADVSRRPRWLGGCRTRRRAACRALPFAGAAPRGHWPVCISCVRSSPVGAVTRQQQPCITHQRDSTRRPPTTTHERTSARAHETRKQRESDLEAHACKSDAATGCIDSLRDTVQHTRLAARVPRFRQQQQRARSWQVAFLSAAAGQRPARSHVT